MTNEATTSRRPRWEDEGNGGSGGPNTREKRQKAIVGGRGRVVVESKDKAEGAAGPGGTADITEVVCPRPPPFEVEERILGRGWLI
jgi:hypothetical protein